MDPMPAPSTGYPTHMTVEEFLAVPETEPGHWQLVEGEVVVYFPTWQHQKAIENLLFAFGQWRRAASGRGSHIMEVDTAAGPDSMLGPDLQWYAEGRELNDRFSRPQPLGDLIVEVRSPSTWAVDIGRKRAIYERMGVQELWLVDPYSQTVLTFGRVTPDAPTFDVAAELGGDEELTSRLLDGFAVPVAEIFRD